MDTRAEAETEPPAAITHDARQRGAAYRRIVSLVPSTTETLFALGAADRVVGVTDYCALPARMPAHVVRVGGTRTPDIERIRALQPDLVVASEEENRQEDVARLAEFAHVHISGPRSVAVATRDLRALGELIDLGDRAALLSQQIEAAASELRSAARPYRFAYLVWYDPWMVAGADTFISDLLALGGGQNVVHLPRQRGRYPVVELAELARWQPDVIWLPDEPYAFGPLHAAEVRAALGPGWTGRCQLVAGRDFCWHGVRLLESLPRYRSWLLSCL